MTQRDLGEVARFVYDRIMSAGSPHYLIAVPQLGDPNFARKIILMLHHDEGGALGLVVNDPTNLTLGAFAQTNNMNCHAKIAQTPVYRGGPVTPEQGWILHANSETQEKKEIVPGLFLSGQVDTLRHLLEAGDTTMRLLLGYAGWGAGQLETELAQGAWLTSEASAHHTLQTDPEVCWTAVLYDMGIDPATLTMGSSIPS